MNVLVDTSVWVDHFRHRNAALAALLAQDAVLTHPLVLGELACGTAPAPRARTLADIAVLRQAIVASAQEVMAFIEQHTLHGLGCGYVDIALLAATRMTPGARLWTRDQRLAALAARLGAGHDADTR